MKSRVSNILYDMMKLYVEELLRVCGIFLVVINVFLLFPAPATATAIMNILSDRYDTQAWAMWGDNPYWPAPAGKPAGTVESTVSTGSLFFNTGASHTIVGNGGQTNMAWAYATLTAHFEADSFNVTVQTLVDDDIPGSINGYGFARSEWNILFDIHGDGAFLDGPFGPPLEDGSSYIDRMVFFDLTSLNTTIYTTPMSIALLDGHQYGVSIISQQKDWSLDVSSSVMARFRSVTVKVPEPSSLLLFGAGILGVAGIVRRKKR